MNKRGAQYLGGGGGEAEMPWEGPSGSWEKAGERLTPPPQPNSGVQRSSFTFLLWSSRHLAIPLNFYRKMGNQGENTMDIQFSLPEAIPDINPIMLSQT